ncbi:MAG TPA: hypothetical protein VFJ97_16790 [Dermatophilaceae bacterium]|nr:hypothetical protein [Dermatophilaceae bacterium]
MRARWWVLVPAVVALAAGVLGIGVRSTYGGSASVDEPQYLLTALSLWEDHDLDIADELSAGRWRDFHQAQLPVQTRVLPDGRQVSPHDPLLPLLLAAPMGLFGWVGAKLTMAAMAAVAAGLLAFLAVRRFALPPAVGAAGAALAFGSPPLAVYAQQVYPELPAALAVLVAVAALSAPRPTGRHLAAAVAALTALAWLGAKYALVGAALAVGALVVARGPGHAGGSAGGHAAGPALRRAGLALAGSAALWLAGHRLIYGGWTPYATGDHFQASGELSVVGVDPDYVGRSLRLVGLLVDDHFGLVPWQPAYLALPAALSVLLWRLRADQRLVWLLAGPLLAGWATAVWVALTMHGYWWPGRQVVVVLPLAVLVLMVALRRYATGLAALALAGALNLAALLWAGRRGDLTWVYAFDRVPSPVYQAMRAITPDYRDADFLPGHLAWAGLLLASCVLALRLTRPGPLDIQTPAPNPRKETLV